MKQIFAAPVAELVGASNFPGHIRRNVGDNEAFARFVIVEIVNEIRQFGVINLTHFRRVVFHGFFRFLARNSSVNAAERDVRPSRQAASSGQ